MATSRLQIPQYGERRASDRFEINQEVRYKILGSRGHSRTGVGKTLDISSSGILFTTEDCVAAGKRVQVSMDWPAKLNGSCRLKLVALGKVVRSDVGQVAVRIEKYEFRTQGTRGLD